MPTELLEQLINRFRWVDPGPTSTHLVSDISGWWREPQILTTIGAALAEPFRAQRPTVVTAPETTGLLIGPLVAVALGVGFVPAHKGRPATDHQHGGYQHTDYQRTDGRRIAEPVTWARTGPDYRDRSLAIGVRERHLSPDDRVLVVDDWVASGAQIQALYQVISARGATALGTSAIVADCPPEMTRRLRLHALLTADQLAPDPR